MKKRRYSSGMKAAVLVVHQCLATVLALCMTILILLFQGNVLNFGEKRNISYEDTDYFTNQFENAATDILDFVDLRRKFETDGNYDADKKVDIWRYYQNPDAMENMAKRKKSNMLTYRLGDLAEWSKGFSVQQLEVVAECYLDDGLHQKVNIYRDEESVFSQDEPLDSLKDLMPQLREEIVREIEHNYGGSYSVSSTGDSWAIVRSADEEDVTGAEPHGEEPYTDNSALETYVPGSGVKYENDLAADSTQIEDEDRLDEKGQDIVRKVISGRLYDLDVEELEWLLKDMDMGYYANTSTCECVMEDYLPVKGVAIWDMFLRGDCTLEYMQNAYQALQYTLENVNEEISRYRKGINNYNQQGHSTNVYYWVTRGREENVYTNIEDSKGMNLPAFGKKLGKYVLFREKDTHLLSNVKDMNEFFYNRIEPLYVGKESVLFIGVDVNFPYEDDFWEAKQEYNRMHPWIKICLWGAVMCFLLELICLIYLSTVAGKRDDSGEIYLNFFDKIPTELLFVPASVTIIFFVYGLASVWLYDDGNFMIPILMSCSITFFGTALLLVFYLSFIRRIRAGVLWHHSILRWFVHGIGQLFTQRKSCTKMVIWFGLHLLACLFILPMISASYDGGACVTGVFFFAVLCGVEAVLIIREGVQRNRVMEGISKISDGDLEYKIEEQDLKGDNRKLAQAVNTIGEGLHHAVDESMKNERLQADLITNVSHDIKTPLTSIINYVDLLKREDLQNERVQNYIAVLDSKSQRLKQLAEDLVEASKISSGNISLNMERINLVELVHQTDGEFAERFAQRELQVVSNLPTESVVILADGRRIWRVLENLYGNVAKYAMEKTRVYMDLQADGEKVSFSIKNISKNPLNIAADELTERFIRGDISRSTEGSGLGLSIAQNLTTLMGGTFEIYLDGDLFKVMIGFGQE